MRPVLKMICRPQYYIGGIPNKLEEKTLTLRLVKYKRKKHRYDMGRKKRIGLLAVIVLTLFVGFMPMSWIGMDGMTVLQQRSLAVFVFAAMMWILEIIPAWATSVCIISLLLFSVSDEGFLLTPLAGGGFAEGTVADHVELMASFANPIIILFLGGFVLAGSAGKVGLDAFLAKNLLRMFGSRPHFVLLGFLLLNGLFSMFMSNTATAAMMFTFIVPVLKRMPRDERGCTGLALSIPIAANLGGLGTPIGTPPNAIALAQLSELGVHIGFRTWMLHLVPYVFIMLLFAWLLLMWLYPFKSRKIIVEIEDSKPHGRDYWIVVGTFVATIMLWITGEWTGYDSNIIAMVPIAVFSATGIFGKEDLAKIDWAVLWMVAGGFALGTACSRTGLGTMLINAVPFSSWAVWVVIIVAGLMIYVISTFISNTSAANLLMPILALLGTAMGSSLTPYGGVATLLVYMAVGASLAMTLPISTPPNAIACSTGLVPTRQMLLVGTVIGVVGAIVGYAWIVLFPL